MRRIGTAGLICLGLAVPALAEGDAVAGKAVFRKCAACHTLERVNKVGPTLAGVVGRPVASVGDYGYSAAMTAFADGGKVWNEGLLAEYLMSPKAMVPGTRMTFVGLRRPQDIADLIAYLKNPGGG
ncbi:c-type cytochrome [Shinella pollutisoli]|uniref:C-type cytochrome n=1 Tax=Shinella pollutisoli TaxID=2250594 RepID=A0ABV7DL20_9HYPH|nr:cytochrome c family protein [Shinella pollutisoli]